MNTKAEESFKVHQMKAKVKLHIFVIATIFFTHKKLNNLVYTVRKIILKLNKEVN